MKGYSYTIYLKKVVAFLISIVRFVLIVTFKTAWPIKKNDCFSVLFVFLFCFVAFVDFIPIVTALFVFMHLVWHIQVDAFMDKYPV